MYQPICEVDSEEKKSGQFSNLILLLNIILMLSNIVKHFFPDFHIFHSSLFINFLFKDLTSANSGVNVAADVSV